MDNEETYERLVVKSRPEYKGSTMFKQATNPVVGEVNGPVMYSNGVYKENKEKENN